MFMFIVGLFFLAQRHGVKSLRIVPNLQPLRRADTAESTQELQLTVRCRLRAVQVGLQAIRELELDENENMGQGDGSEAEGDFKRRRNPQFTEWAPS